MLGDVNVSLIQTARGRTIYLGHNTNNPRPYSRLQLLQGTRGIVSGWPYRVHLEGRSPEHRWEDAEAYYPEFDHPLWRSKRIQEMESYGAEVVRAPGDYESVVLASRARAAAEELYDANAGGANTAIQLRSYGPARTIGCNAASFSSVVVRGCSSRSTLVASPPRPGTSSGAISAA